MTAGDQSTGPCKAIPKSAAKRSSTTGGRRSPSTSERTLALVDQGEEQERGHEGGRFAEHAAHEVELRRPTPPRPRPERERSRAPRSAQTDQMAAATKDMGKRIDRRRN